MKYIHPQSRLDGAPIFRGRVSRSPMRRFGRHGFMRWHDGFPLYLAALLMRSAVAASGDTNAPVHHLPDLTVRPERDVLVTPMLESAALDPARIDITADDLAMLKPASASDALKAAPAIHTETRGRKYKQFHSFRGQVYPYPDLVLDGIWQREALELLYVYPGAMIERIEIMRSSATLFTGLADAVGVINVVPRGPRLDSSGSPLTETGVEAGSYGAARAYAHHDTPAGPAGAANLGAQYYRVDGRSGRNAAEEIGSLYGAWVHSFAPGHRIEWSAWMLHGERELEMPDPDGPASANLKNQRERYDPLTYGHVRLRGVHHPSDRFSTDWRVFFSDRRARYHRRKIDPALPGPGDMHADEDDREYGAQVIQGYSPHPDNTARLGLFLHRWTAPNGKQSYVGARQDVGSVAVVLADEHRVGDWTFDAGVRYARSYFYDFSGPAFDITGQSTRVREVRNEWDEPVLSGALGASLAVNARHRLHLHGGLGERRPGPGAVRADGSSPATEQRMNADAGWTMQWGPDGDGRVNVGGFGVWRRDAVTRINETGMDAAGNAYYFSDNHDVRQHGLEAEARSPGLWRHRLALFGAVTWMLSERKHDGNYETYGEVPERILSLGLRAANGPWDGGLIVKHVSRFANFRFARDGEYHDLGDYWDVTLSGGVRFGRDGRTRIYGVIDNLLDDAYSTVVGWSDPGRRFRVGLESAF